MNKTRSQIQRKWSDSLWVMGLFCSFSSSIDDHKGQAEDFSVVYLGLLPKK